MSKPTSHSAGTAGSKLIDRRPILKAMLNPKVIALVGATEAPDSVGRALMENLASFGGVVYPINPKRRSVLGVEAFPNIEAVPNPVDLAIIATRRTHVKGFSGGRSVRWPGSDYRLQPLYRPRY
jgi:acetyltransferase